MRRAGQVYEPFFKGKVIEEKDQITWLFEDRIWPVLSKHKPRGRRRSSRDPIRATIGGVR